MIPYVKYLDIPIEPNESIRSASLIQSNSIQLLKLLQLLNNSIDKLTLQEIFTRFSNISLSSIKLLKKFLSIFC